MDQKRALSKKSLGGGGGEGEAGESNGNAATHGNSKKREGEALYLTQGTAPWLLDPASPRYDMGEPDGDLMVEEVLAQMSEWSDTPRNSSWRAGQYYTADLMALQACHHACMGTSATEEPGLQRSGRKLWLACPTRNLQSTC